MAFLLKGGTAYALIVSVNFKNRLKKYYPETRESFLPDSLLRTEVTRLSGYVNESFEVTGIHEEDGSIVFADAGLKVVMDACGEDFLAQYAKRLRMRIEEGELDAPFDLFWRESDCAKTVNGVTWIIHLKHEPFRDASGNVRDYEITGRVIRCIPERLPSFN